MLHRTPPPQVGYQLKQSPRARCKCLHWLVGETPGLASLKGLHVTFLVRPLEWWDRLAFILVERVTNHGPIPYINATMWSLLPSQGVFHPVLVVSVWVIFSGMGTTRLLPVSSSRSCLRTARIISSFKCGLPQDGYTYAQVNRFLSSSVSTKSEFQIMLLSLIPIPWNI
jgi:hypothetical protein